jgi:hypothetical protein
LQLGVIINVCCRVRRIFVISICNDVKSRQSKSRVQLIFLITGSVVRTILKFLGAWEEIYNPNFKVVEFDHFKIREPFTGEFIDT